MRDRNTLDDSRVESGDVWISVGLTIVVLVIYHLNLGFYASEDATSSARITMRSLDDCTLLFIASEIPSDIVCILHGGNNRAQVSLASFDEHFAELCATGLLTAGDEYCVGGRCVPTIHQGVYANTFSPGAGITAVPVFALLRVFFGPLSERPDLMWPAGKFAASICTAVSVGFVYLTCTTFVQRRFALLVALAYGLGTCVWTISSQTLWQHGPNAMYLATGTFCLTRANGNMVYAAGCGAFYAAATWCRPTEVILVTAVGGYLLISNRQALLTFVLAGLPLGLAMLAYNTYYFGSPLVFGQTLMQQVAIDKTGSSEMWQTPLTVGLLGLLLSPSRGLFVFSPFLLFAAPGLYKVWRSAKFAVLRPLSLAIPATWTLEAMHYDWWGGWSYGYRHIVDTVPLLALFLAPVIGSVLAHRPLRWMFSACLAWSVLVQAVGAAAFNMESWNARRARLVRKQGETKEMPVFSDPNGDAPSALGEVVALNVDRPEYRYRLWSVTDSQILYYLTHFSEARVIRRHRMMEACRPSSVRLAESHCAVGDAWMRLGDFVAAADEYEAAMQHVPEFREGIFGSGLALVAQGEMDTAAAVFRRALKRSPDDKQFSLRLGAVLLLQGNTRAAFARFHRAISEDLDAIYDYSQISRTWQDSLSDTEGVNVGPFRVMDELLNNTREGLVSLRAARRTAKSESEPLLRAAADYFDRVVDREPDLPEVHLDLGQAHFELGDYDSAISNFSRASELDPNLADAHDGLGMCHAHRGDFIRAQVHFAKAIQIDPTHEEAARHLEAVKRRLKQQLEEDF